MTEEYKPGDRVRVGLTTFGVLREIDSLGYANITRDDGDIRKKFKVGDRVEVIKGFRTGEVGMVAYWPGLMDKLIGARGTITADLNQDPGGSLEEYPNCYTINFDFLHTYTYPYECLKFIPEGTSSPKFKIGDQVRVMREMTREECVGYGWVVKMDSTIGKTGTVISLMGPDSYPPLPGCTVRFDEDATTWRYANCVLELVNTASPEAVTADKEPRKSEYASGTHTFTAVFADEKGNRYIIPEPKAKDGIWRTTADVVLADIWEQEPWKFRETGFGWREDTSYVVTHVEGLCWMKDMSRVLRDKRVKCVELKYWVYLSNPPLEPEERPLLSVLW